MNRKQMKNISRKLEEQMSADEWAVWIAGKFYECESTREYLAKAFDCPDTQKSDYYRPQFVCESMGAKKEEDFAKYREVAFECRLRSHLALYVNSYLDDFFEGQKENLILRMTQHELYLFKQELIKYKVPNNIESIRFHMRCDVASIFGEYDERIIPTMEALAEAVALIEKEMYGGQAFLTEGNRVDLVNHTEQAVQFKDAVGEGFEDLGSMPTEYYKARKNKLRDMLHDGWLAEARADVRAHIYGDDSEQTKLLRQSLVYETRFDIDHHVNYGGAA